MFIGHYAAAFTAKKIAPKVSLGVLFFAAQFLDVLWPVLLLADIEHVRVSPGITAFTPLDLYDYPYSHSLAAVVVWSFAFGLIYFAVRRRLRDAIVLGALVLSHWALDLIAHRPDLPFYPGSETYAGLGLWNSVAGSIMVEGFLFIAGVYVYASSTRPVTRFGTYGLTGLVAFLIVLWVGNIVSVPPDDVKILGYASLFLCVLFPVAHWIDRKRALK